MSGGTKKGCVDLNMLTRIIIFTCCAKVCLSGLCDQNRPCSVKRVPPEEDQNGDLFTNNPYADTCDTCEPSGIVVHSGDVGNHSCWCQCEYGRTLWPGRNICSDEQTPGCKFRVNGFALSKAATIDNLSTNELQFWQQNRSNWVNVNPSWSCTLLSQTYLENDGRWRNLNCATSADFHIHTMDGNMYIQWSGPNNDKAALGGLLLKLLISCSSRPMLQRSSCLLFKIIGTHTYDPGNPPQCEDTTTDENSLARKDRDPTAAIAGGTAAAVIIFIMAGVALFILWRRKFRPRNVGKHKNQRVTMSSLQNGHPNNTDGTVDNEIYAGDDAGIVDNVIYEGGMGADGVFSNPGYADKTPQFKPRMDAPGAFVQPNPGATNKTPTPQRNIIIDEPQYAQIVDDQYADPQKVRDNKDKKNKKKATKDENYADLKGPHEKQPGANNSNSNHIYQGLNKGMDYQSLRGPREHHQVKPSQVPKTPQDYTSLTPGRSKPSAGTLSKEEADYTVLEGPESPGEETAAGPDYTTLDGPDSPGDETTSGPDYTVLDGPDSPGY
ncbi:Hypp2674 [Branchiostoma lanceolatum]|uniref:Hypp2674 protein n=1 Tax=Branchiostoma lanceolatum TaxID=7740 RepID=A0A8K0EP41_BRALA|nr:Hypp2674 [Branchiostoma lanceolatum]